MPSPAAAAVPAATVYLYPDGLLDQRAGLAVLAMVIVPALLMVSSIRYRSFKTLDLQTRRPFRVLLLFAVLIALVVTHPQLVLASMAYLYLVSGTIGWLWGRVFRRSAAPEAAAAAPETGPKDV
jgi:CDP-diacylglycerol--serine O-phosphatidyltransferase